MEAPEEVRKTFERLRTEYPYYIVLARINGRFYVYKSKAWWDKESRKVRSKKEYLGRITEGVEFIKKVVVETVNQPVITAVPKYDFDKVDESILMHLSMNCRIPLSVIAKRLGLTLQTVERRKAELEDRYGIRYFASINYRKLGFSTYLAMVKFKNKKPSAEVLKEVSENEPRVQLAMISTGAYDLILYMLAEDNFVISNIIYKFTSDERLKDYEADWNTTIVTDDYGYVPLRDRFFDLLEKRVWKRSKETPRPASDSLMYREYVLLRELNATGNKPFAEIERKYGFGHGTAKYVFDRLKEKNLIWRLTLTMNRYNVKYNAMIVTKVVNEGIFLKDREKFLRYVIKDYEALANRFALMGEILAPFGNVFIAPILREGELEAELEWLNTQIGGIGIDSSIVTQIILGELCYRRVDNKHSNQMKRLVEVYKVEPPKEVINYFAE
jgi:DNA-binding Lrp family transcriptional regulator